MHIVSWVVKMTGDIEQAVASCSDCKGLALHCCFCGSVFAGGSVTAFSKWLPMFIEILGAALVSMSAAAFILLCAATASSSCRCVRDLGRL